MGVISMLSNLRCIQQIFIAGIAALAMSGCAATPYLDADAPPPQVDVTQAALPTAVQPYPRIERVLGCIRETGVLRRRTFVVGSFADSTGKINAVAEGSTGNFVPQGGSASYVTDALRKAGGTVISTYFGPPQQATHADFAINGIFNSLDFNAPVSGDVRVGGVGPIVGNGWAQLTLSIQLDQAHTRINRQMSMIQRPVRYQEIGAGAGRDFGGLLVTGTIVFRNQERLQFEALNGPIALGVADVVMKEFPKAAERCRGMVADLLHTVS
jgi:hypothetical protein